AVFVSVPADDLLRLRSPFFWLLVGATLLGSVAGNMRGIALSTCVTLLVPDGQRDRANGMVGMTTGVSFAITSVFSGLVIGTVGMGWAYYGALILTAVALVHVATISIDEAEPAPAAAGSRPWDVDVRGAIDAIRAVPGLKMLILLGACNNLLAGVFMSLMDAYGLELVSVEAWGLLWGFISLGFIAGGVAVSRYGVGSIPLRAVVAGNFINWAICSIFAVRSSIVLLTIGMVVWLTLIPVIEAAEQTILPAGDPLRAPGPGLRVRPARRELGVTADRVRDGASRRIDLHALHDRRRRRPVVRRLVRHRSRPRPRPDVHHRRRAGCGRHGAGVDVGFLPPAGAGHRPRRRRGRPRRPARRLRRLSVAQEAGPSGRPSLKMR
ncbi:MAG: MFS transporter, partial [Acidimicrobiales bacterium]|nr:MFS transporter [Acidimicrobiales bacterium]